MRCSPYESLVRRPSRQGPAAHSILAAVLSALLCASAAAVEPPDLLPSDNEIPGWVRHGDPMIAETEAELYGLINGAATTYIENGFQSCIFQQYLGTIAAAPESLWVRVFDQGDAAGAQGVYDALATGLEEPWGGAGEEARINDTFLFVITVEFWRNEFYVVIEVPKGGDPAEALTVAQDFAVVIDGYAVPVELSLFEADRVPSGVALRWITQSETDCFGFHLWRAAGHNDFARITEAPVPGAGTSTRPSEYSYRDAEVPRGVELFYRLEQIDADGTSHWYGPLSVPAVEAGSWGRLKAAFGYGDSS